MRWAIVTGEYPPQPGGVSDYTRLVARGLADAGDAVAVYAPRVAFGKEAADAGVHVNRLPDHFGPRSLVALDRALARRPRPDRVLLQYVPHAFGWKGMNLPFAAWVAARAGRFAPLWVMFHEVAFPLEWPPRHAVVGLVTHAMARLIAGAAARVFVSIPAWGALLRKLSPRSPAAEWLPIPCVVGTNADPAAVAAVRAKFAATTEPLVGHFGTFGPLIADLVEPAAVRLLRENPTARLLLIGRGSESFQHRLAAAVPDLAARSSATGELGSHDIAAHLRACDLLLQPFVDGVSSRRTSVMAGLANGVAVVTNAGFLSEPFWSDAGCVALAVDPAATAAAAAALLADPAARAALGRRGVAAYRDHFSPARLIARLRGEVP